jgi:hypothetical protein
MSTRSEPQWFKSSYSGGSGTECVETAFLQTGVLLRDSKRPSGSVVSIPTEAWARFIGALGQDTCYTARPPGAWPMETESVMHATVAVTTLGAAPPLHRERGQPLSGRQGERGAERVRGEVPGDRRAGHAISHPEAKDTPTADRRPRAPRRTTHGRGPGAPLRVRPAHAEGVTPRTSPPPRARRSLRVRRDAILSCSSGTAPAMLSMGRRLSPVRPSEARGRGTPQRVRARGHRAPRSPAARSPLPTGC